MRATTIPIRARLYIASILATGAWTLWGALRGFHSAEPAHYICQLLLSLIASGLKIKLPGIESTMSAGHVFMVLSLVEFSYSESVVLAALSALVQVLWRPKTRPQVLKAAFSIASMVLTVTAAYAVYEALPQGRQMLPMRVSLAASSHFLVNTLAVAAVVSLTGNRKLFRTWRSSYLWSFPHYLVGAAAAVLIHELDESLGWQTAIIWPPVVFLIFRSGQQYLGRLEAEKLQAEGIAALHLRTIEALALAIEAKDERTNDHLQRVQVYAVELGKAMGLEGDELDALRAASILHDIGKLAVPEHILSKPGKLTPEEFEKIKTHPAVGAEIVARVQFPCDVAPIVRSHHEKWNGAGYPDRLKGEEIPLGARLLSVVDCFDALASDRPYRSALPLDEAMAVIAAESGTSFDPRIVEVLEAHYQVWEELAWGRQRDEGRVIKEIKAANGAAPATGLQAGVIGEPGFLTSIAAARQEAQTLYELTQRLGNSLNLHETLSVLDSQLRRLIVYDTIAVYMLRDGRLTPEYVNGEGVRLFSSIEIPVGRGLSGWVAETEKPIVNGNPSLEPGPGKFSEFQSALAAPLTNATGTIGVLTLYHREAEAFTGDHLRVLLAINPKVSLTIENVLKYHQTTVSATTDALTSLPNARSLFLRLDAELSRAGRTSEGVAIVMCDLDGFKQVNDRFGHLEGNRVLKLVASGLQACCGESESVARMGGDEFVLVFPGLAADDLAEKLTAIDRVVVEAGLAVCGERLLGISVGAAFCPEDGADAESLLAEADRRMYLAKQRRKSDVAAADLAALARAVGSESEAAARERVPPWTAVLK